MKSSLQPLVLSVVLFLLATIQIASAAELMEVDLAVAIAQPDDDPAQFSLYSVDVQVWNDGTAPATSVVLSLPLPTGVVYEGGNEFSSSQGRLVTFGPNQGQWSVGTLAAGDTARITVRYFLLESVAAPSYVEVQSVNEVDVDSTPGNGTPPTPNEDDEASTATTAPCGASATLVSTSCDDAGTPADPSDDTYQVTFTINAGGRAGQWIGFSPQGFPLVSGAYGDTVTLDAGLIGTAFFNTVALTIREVNGNACQIGFSWGNDVPDACSNGSVGGDIDLSLTLSQNPAEPDQYSLYEVVATVRNDGPSVATGVTVDLPRPAGVVYEGGNEFTASQGQFEVFGRVEGQWSVGQLAPGASATLAVRYFLLESTAPHSYAEVLAANESDLDSTPGNGNGQVNEDDEASTGGTPPPSCGITVSVVDVVCQDAGTPSDPDDDTFEVTFLVDNRTPGTSGTWRFGPSFGTAGPGGSYGVPFVFNAGLIAAASFNPNAFVFVDTDDASCFSTGAFGPPATCSTTPPNDPCAPIAAPAPVVRNVQLANGGIVTVDYVINGTNRSKTIDVPTELGVTLISPTVLEVDEATAADQVIYILGTYRDDVSPGIARPFLISFDVAGQLLSSVVPALNSVDLRYLELIGLDRDRGRVLVGFETAGRSYGVASLEGTQVVAERRLVGDLVTNRVSGAVNADAEGVVYLSYRDGNSASWPRVLVLAEADLSTLADVRLGELPYPNATFITGLTGTPLLLPNGNVAVPFTASSAGDRGLFAAILDPTGGVVSWTQLPNTALFPGQFMPYTPLGVTANGDIQWVSNTSVGLRMLVVWLADGTVISCGPFGTMGVDLELTATSERVAPPIFDRNTVTLTLTNAGIEDATGVVVDAPLPANVVYVGGNEFTASQGDLVVFGPDAGTWTVGDLAAGATATLVLHYFSLSDVGYIQFAQVQAADQPDVDSSPGNARGGIAREDDEFLLDLRYASQAAQLTLAPNPLPDGQRVWLNYVSSGALTRDYLISDLKGRVLHRGSVSFVEGRNSIPVTVGDLPAGVYTVSFPGPGLSPKRLVVR